MSLHLAKTGNPFVGICDGNAARTTTDPSNEQINCNRCLDLLGRGEGKSQLDRVMIHRTSSRVLARACWSCGKSDTYCDGLVEQRDEFCCRTCFRAEHDTHTGQ